VGTARIDASSGFGQNPAGAINIYALLDSSQQVQIFYSIQTKMSNYVEGHYRPALDKPGDRAVENKKSAIDKFYNFHSCIPFKASGAKKKITQKKQFPWRDKSFKVRCKLGHFFTSTSLVKQLRQRCKMARVRTTFTEILAQSAWS